MFRQRRCYALRIILLLFCAAGLSPARAQSTGTDTVYHLHGTVVNGMNGKPLAHALVQSGDRRIATMSGSEGHFTLDVVVPPAPAADRQASASLAPNLRRFSNLLFLNAQKPGYMPPDQPVFVSLDDTLDSTDVTLKLMPAGAISGRVSASGTDSLSNIQVQLLLHQPTDDGRMTWAQAGTYSTKGRGEFHFTNLRPGEYTIMTSEWRGDLPTPPRNVPTDMYVPVFNGDQPTLESAVKLRLHYGDTAQAELHLHLATYYPITIPIANHTENGGINARVKGTLFNGFQLRFNNNVNAVEGLLPSGQYEILLTQYGPQPQRNFALATVNVENAAVRTTPVALLPASSISVRVHTQFTKQENIQPQSFRARSSTRNNGSGGNNNAEPTEAFIPNMQLMLRAEDGGNYMGVTAPSGSPNELTLQNIQPGRYIVRPNVFRGYVASITAGGVDLLEHSLVVNSSGTAPAIEVTLRDDNVTLSGTVTSGGAPLPAQTFLLLLPTDSGAQFNQSYAGPDGKFQVYNLVPGSYHVVALRNLLRQIPYRDAEAMRPYEGKGVSVTVTPGQKLQLDVPLTDDEKAEIP